MQVRVSHETTELIISPIILASLDLKDPARQAIPTERPISGELNARTSTPDLSANPVSTAILGNIETPSPLETI